MTVENDANADALQRLRAQGDDLTHPRNIDFSVVFPNENAASEFAVHFRNLGYKVSVKRTDTEEGLPWDALVVKFMVPSAEGIAEFERTLQSVATPLSGRNDGWGCFAEPS
jgi:hypothetical protein